MNVKREFVTICEAACRAGAAVLREMFGRVSVREKGPADLVTEADLASQEAIRRVVLDVFPDHGFLGEEAGGHVAGASADGFRWIVDPLDGTTNFAHGVPFFSVSVALEAQGHLHAAAVFNPIADEMFAAAAGQGARLNGRPIRTSGVARAAEALAAIGFPPGVNGETEDLRAFLAALPRFQALRRTGSAALNLAYVAAGRFDAAWSFAARSWDMAAGVLLVAEAGGVATGPRGEPLDVNRGHFLVAANEPLHAEVKGILASA
ncbi:MAG: inositol monophosphatase [Pirellulales bacterium]|nr:inositol monophosphatase [Pirellulales bacterium]